MAIIITWNPNTSEHSWNEIPDASKKTLSGEPYFDWWNVGRSTKQVKKGSRLYLLLQGDVPQRGVVGSGWAISEPYPQVMPKTGKTLQAVDAEFDVMLDPAKFDPFDWRIFKSGPLSKVKWTTQISGIYVPDELELYWREHVNRALGYTPYSLSDDGIESEEIEFPEGRCFYRLHRHIERNQQLVKEAKAKAKQEGKFHCWACKFDFAKFYGERGDGYIEAHHTKVPVSQVGENGGTKVEDMAMVCSNCHRMLHRTPWMSIDELAEVIAGQSGKKIKLTI